MENVLTQPKRALRSLDFALYLAYNQSVKLAKQKKKTEKKNKITDIKQQYFLQYLNMVKFFHL